MNIRKSHLALIAASVFCTAAYAQGNIATDVQRDENQQERIEQGLKSGQLNTKEAGRLEREQQVINRTEANATKDGKITAQEQARIKAEQNRASSDIYREKHDAQVGNPNSASSLRMQKDVQRNVNQEARIEQGVKSGQLTNREAGKLERGQAHVDRKEANAAADGRVGAREQGRIQRTENRQSRRIYRKKHNAVTK